jgi:hypothetical protein
MTQDQENIVTMFETTRDYLDGNSTLWSAKVAFAAAVTAVKNGITAIRNAAAQQESPTSGITDEKSFLRNALEDLTLEIGDQLSALAAKNQDMGLSATVHVTRSSLDQAQDDDLVQTAERVRNAINANIAALANYDVNAAKVTALTNAITTFSDKKTAPSTAKAARSGSTASLTSLIQTTRSVFRNQLDKLMTPFRKTNPDFYSGYFAARVIVNRAATQAVPPAAPPSPNPGA